MVYFELLIPGETVNTDRYRQQIINVNHALIEKRPEWARRNGKVILQHDNGPSHAAKVVKNILKAMNCEILSHPPYSPDLTPSDSLAEQCFANFEEVKKWLVEWFARKEKKYFGMVSMICLKDGQNV